MTAVLEHSQATAVAWTALDETLWVASTDGEYAGMVEFRDGRFGAQSGTGQHLGDFVSVLRAKAAVEAGPVRSIPLPYVAAVAASAVMSAAAVTLTALAVL